MKEIYANRKGNVQKSKWYTVLEASMGTDYSIHAETDRTIHASHRRIIEHAFTEKALRSAESFVVSNVRTFQDIVGASVTEGESGEKGWSKPFNMSQWSTCLNYDIMGDLVFGRRFNCMTSEEHRFVPRLLTNSAAFLYTVSSQP